MAFYTFVSIKLYNNVHVFNYLYFFIAFKNSAEWCVCVRHIWDYLYSDNDDNNNNNNNNINSFSLTFPPRNSNYFTVVVRQTMRPVTELLQIVIAINSPTAQFLFSMAVKFTWPTYFIFPPLALCSWIWGNVALLLHVFNFFFFFYVPRLIFRTGTGSFNH